MEPEDSPGAEEAITAVAAGSWGTRRGPRRDRVVLPLIMPVAFGIVECSAAYHDSSVTADAARAGGRTGSAQARNANFAINAATSVDRARATCPRTRRRAVDLQGERQRLPGHGHRLQLVRQPTASSTPGTRRRRRSTTRNPQGGGWAASTQQVCREPFDEIGVYVKINHKFVTGFFGPTITLTDHSVFRFEPVPSVRARAPWHAVVAAGAARSDESEARLRPRLVRVCSSTCSSRSRLGGRLLRLEPRSARGCRRRPTRPRSPARCSCRRTSSGIAFTTAQRHRGEERLHRRRERRDGRRRARAAAEPAEGDDHQDGARTVRRRRRRRHDELSPSMRSPSTKRPREHGQPDQPVRQRPDVQRRPRTARTNYPDFWANVFGPSSQKAKGDAIQSTICGGADNCADAPTPTTTRTVTSTRSTCPRQRRRRSTSRRSTRSSRTSATTAATTTPTRTWSASPEPAGRTSTRSSRAPSRRRSRYSSAASQSVLHRRHVLLRGATTSRRGRRTSCAGPT